MTRPTLHTTVRRALIAALVAAPLLHGVAALADGGRDDHEEALEAVRSGTVLPLRDILDRAHAQFDGEMLEAELDRDHGDWVYELEMMTPRGAVLKLWYDARDGALLNGRGHGLMHAYRGDLAALPERMRLRHERMMERRDAGDDDGPPWHRRWFGRLWGDDARPGPPKGPPPGRGPLLPSDETAPDEIEGDE